MLLTAKSFKTFPKHNKYVFYFRALCFELIDAYPITIQKKCFLLCSVDLNTNLFFTIVKSTEYLATTVAVVLSHPSVDRSLRTAISFFLLSVCLNEPFSKKKIIFTLITDQQWKLWTTIKFNTLIYPYLSGSAFVVNLTTPQR